MAIFGYARVSTVDQDLTIQKEALQAAGCDDIKSEEVSGSTREGRVELNKLMEYMRSGDTLVVTRVDRLARSIRDLQNIVHELKERGVTIRATEQSIDTNTSEGNAFLGMLGVFSEFETTIRKERQMEGIARAKKNGVYTGRKPTARAKAKEVMALLSDGVSKAETARQLDISEASVYRIVRASKAVT